MAQSLGVILTGSLTDGFIMRMNSMEQLSSLKTGRFVSIKGTEYTFFSLVTDLKLEVSNPEILSFPPQQHEELLCLFLQKNDMYATAILRPMLMLDRFGNCLPVKTIPNHFTPVFEADAQEVARIFGDEKDPSNNYLHVGAPLDMKAPVCLDLHKFGERSNGIFGKTGTGKTFLTRLVLAGLIKKQKAVNLIFDMHSEYGLQARREGNKHFVKGLKTLFPDKIAICSLDPASTRRRGANPDIELVLDYQSIRVDDILSLQEELNLHPTACEVAYLIAARYKKDWLQVLLAQGDRLKDFALEIGAHGESVAALYRKLRAIERLPFFVDTTSKSSSAIDHILEYLDRGISVIIEFGNYTSTFCYLLIANIITRRIHAMYIEKTEKFLGSHAPQDEPKKLMITIEEAHKFLNPLAARQTIFGTIAREMRKYYASLLVVDQRPSGIDAEILSQIGTKFIAQLNDERDIQAALTGIAQAQQLRTVLASLDSKKQVLLLGHAVSMPVVIETRTYDENFYKDMQGFAERNMTQIAHELFS
jgi:hypothetical protein